MQSTQVVFGAGGPLGQALVERLRRDEIPVRAVYRRPRNAEVEGVTEAVADMREASQVASVCEGAEVVYHCANAPYTDWPRQLPAMMRGFVEGLAGSGATAVYADNLYCYGHVSEPIHEGLPSTASTVKGRARAAAAQLLMEAHGQGRLRAVIARNSDFYGPRVVNATLGRSVFEKVLAGRKVELLGRIDQPHSYAYIKDFANALAVLGSAEGTAGEVWHVPCDEPLTAAQFIALAAEVAETRARATAMPKLAFALLSRVVPILREYREMMYEFDRPFIIDSGKYEARFGRDVTPHRQAIAETFDWLRGS
jgi:nucleoside-diphosphate-sugar epimerase